MADSLRDRIKAYENAWRLTLPPRMPIIIRCDGRAFSALTARCAKPYDLDFVAAMDHAAIALCEQAQGVACAYVQSDEVSLLLIPYKKFNSQPWFGGEVEKLVSVSAAIVTAAFIELVSSRISERFLFPRWRVSFDSRVFVVPREDVANVFVDRQQDGRRNAVLGLAQVRYGKKQIHGMSCAALREKLVGEELLEDQAYMNGRMIVRETHEGDSHPARHVVPAPDFKQRHDFFKDLVWPINEETTEESDD
jgi:tRNA(His) guanylyltransferase